MVGVDTPDIPVNAGRQAADIDDHLGQPVLELHADDLALRTRRVGVHVFCRYARRLELPLQGLGMRPVDGEDEGRPVPRKR